MGNSTQTLLGNQLACDAVNPVSLVFNPYQSRLQVLDKLSLALGKASGFLL